MSYFVVVCNSASNSLGLYDLDNGGRLVHLRDMKLMGVGKPDGAYPLTVSPDRTKLYVAFRGIPHEVLTYDIDAGQRTLTLLGRAPLAGSMPHIATDSSGRFLLSAAYGGGKVSINAIAADGVASGPSDTLEAALKMHCCVPIPGSNMFFAASLGADAILKLAFDAEGKLIRLPGQAMSAKGSGPRHLAFHPSMGFAYLVTQSASTVEMFGFDGDGLTGNPLQSISILPPDWQGGAWAADIRVTPNGRFVFASDRRANCLAAFAVNLSTGHLTALGHSSVAPWPRAFNIDANGKFLLVLGENSDVLEVFEIDNKTGALDKRHTAPCGHGPSWVEIIEA